MHSSNFLIFSPSIKRITKFGENKKYSLRINDLTSVRGHINFKVLSRVVFFHSFCMQKFDYNFNKKDFKFDKKKTNLRLIHCNMWVDYRNNYTLHAGENIIKVEHKQQRKNKSVLSQTQFKNCIFNAFQF